jgi:hypothetical protein
MRRLVVLMFALLTLSLPAHGTALAKQPSLAALNVRRADLPAGSQLFDDRQLAGASAIAKADNTTAAAYQRAGVVAADERLFTGGTKRSAALILAVVYRLRSAPAAHAFYVQHAAKAPRTLKRSALASGDEGLDVQGTEMNGGKRTPERVAIFRRAAYVVEVGILPLTRAYPGSLVPRLAALVDARIQAAR